jgi:hypothetical protein
MPRLSHDHPGKPGTWRCKDCGQVVAFYYDGGWEHEPERHLDSCEYWDENEDDPEEETDAK